MYSARYDSRWCRAVPRCLEHESSGQYHTTQESSEPLMTRGPRRTLAIPVHTGVGNEGSPLSFITSLLRLINVWKIFKHLHNRIILTVCFVYVCTV